MRITRLLLTLAACAVASVAQAQSTRYVCTNGTAGSGDATYTLSQLQTAINDSTGAGDIVLLEHGQTFTGSFTLPRHGNAVYATIKTGSTSACAASAVTFPAANIRMTAALAASSNLATLRTNTNNGYALRTVDPAAGLSPGFWRIERLKFASNLSTDWLGSGSIIGCGSDSNSVVTAYSEVPSDFVFSQVYVTGDPTTGQFRGLSMHCNNFSLLDSTIENIKSKTEGQAIFCNSFESGFTVTNSLLSGGTEVILCGGSSGAARPAITVLASPAPTTTTATLSGRSGLRVGKGVTFDVAGAEQYTEIVSCGTSIAGALCTADAVTFTALTAAPAVPGDVDWGLNPGGFTLTKSHVTRPLSMRNPIVGTPQSVTATSATTGGTLAAGTHYYRVVARMKVAASSSDNMAVSAASAEVSATTTGTTGSVALQWTAVTGASEYRVYGRSSGGQNLYFTTASTSYTDTGAAGTTGAVPTGTGTQFLVKNILELKTMSGATINGNIFENTWWMSGGQLYAITFTPSNTGGTNDSTCLKNIEFTNNIVRRAPGGISLTGRDTSTTSGSGESTCRTTGIRFANTLFSDINSTWGATANFMLMSTKYDPVYLAGQSLGPKDVTLEHLTIDHGNGSLINFDLFKTSAARPSENMIFRNILARKASYGLFGNNSCSQGSGCWTAYTSGTTVYNQAVIADATCSAYPAGTICPTSAGLNAEFTDYAAGDYRLKASSVYKNAGTDGTDIGAIIPTITALTDIALLGDNTGGAIVSPPTITTLSAPNGQRNTAYSLSLAGTCAATPCTWGSTGTLPANTTLTGTSSTAATLSGTPLTAGTFTFSITLTDASSRVVSREFTVTIADVVVTEPTPGGCVPVGRAAAYNRIHEGAFFRRALDPSVQQLDADGVTVLAPCEPVNVLDLWGDLTAGRIKYPTALSPAATYQTIANLTDLTTLSATDLTTGTIPDARFPAVLPAISGANLTNLPSSSASTKLIVPFHVPATASSGWTDQPLAEQEMFDTPSKRQRVDTTSFTSVRLSMRVQGFSNSANTPKCYAQYATTDTVDGSTYVTIATDVSLAVAGTMVSSWIAIPAGAKADVFWRVACSGGNAVADPAFGTTSLQFK